MRFSIVVPTKDRADKLKYALRSLAWQTFEDYEVIVSNNHSSDNTAEVIGDFAQANWTCLQPPSAMSMPDHWEFAVSHARGDWVLVLCDDDALIPTALARLDETLRVQGEPEIVRYQFKPYVYDDGVRDTGNFMDLSDRVPFETSKIAPRRQLEVNFWLNTGDMPKMLNCIARRDLLERIRQRYGHLFGPWAPDYNVGAKLLAECSSYFMIGTIALYGENMASYGAGAKRDPEHLLRFLRQFSDFTGRFSHSPYPDLILINNGIFETFQIVREQLGPSFAYLATNPIRLRREMVKDAERYVERGFTQFQTAIDQLTRDVWHERVLESVSPPRLTRRLARTPELIRFNINRRRDKRRLKTNFGPRRHCQFPDILAGAIEVERRLVA